MIECKPEHVFLCSLHEMLGSGVFGTVYRGVWLHKEGEESEQLVEEEVAVKTMEGGANEEERIKFLQEAAIMGQFNHPNIIRLLDISMEGEVNHGITTLPSSLPKMSS